MERVVAATTLPTLLLGGDVADDQAATFARWGEALHVPGAIGLVVGRSLLYPPDDDVAAAVDAAAALVPPRPDPSDEAATAGASAAAPDS
jgi:DhnA family fructose-bisphosphate aldolase class Ia